MCSRYKIIKVYIKKYNTLLMYFIFLKNTFIPIFLNHKNYLENLSVLLGGFGAREMTPTSSTVRCPVVRLNLIKSPSLISWSPSRITLGAFDETLRVDCILL